MKNRLIGLLSILLCIGLLAACTSDDVNQERGLMDEQLHVTIAELQDQIGNLEEQVDNYKKQLAAHNETLKEIERSMLVEKMDDVEHSLSILNKLVKHLPEIEYKSGYITDITQHGQAYYIQFDYIEMLGGEEAIQEVMERDNIAREEVQLGSGFLLKEYPGRSYNYPLSTDSIIYIIDSVEAKYVPLEEFIEYYETSTYPRLYNFTIIEDQLVVIQEQYLP